MSLSLYDATVPLFTQSLTALSHVLDKGAAYAEARKFDPAILVQARLAPDMFPLSRQVQIATDQAKGCCARLAGVEIPNFPDTEQTIPELKARIAKTLDFIKGFKPHSFDGAEARDITITPGGQSMTFKGKAYAVHWTIPNFYFHVTAAYTLLRHNGVDVGKRDFLGSF